MILISGFGILIAAIVVAVIATALVFLFLVIFGSKRGGGQHPGGGVR